MNARRPSISDIHINPDFMGTPPTVQTFQCHKVRSKFCGVSYSGSRFNFQREANLPLYNFKWIVLTPVCFGDSQHQPWGIVGKSLLSSNIHHRDLASKPVHNISYSIAMKLYTIDILKMYCQGHKMYQICCSTEQGSDLRLNNKATLRLTMTNTIWGRFIPKVPIHSLIGRLFSSPLCGHH